MKRSPRGQYSPRKGGRPPNHRFPGVDVLREMLVSQSYEEIAKKIGVTRHTVSNWVGKYDLVGVSPHRAHKFCPTSHEARLQAEYEGRMIEWLQKPLTKRTAEGRPTYWQQMGNWVMGE